MAEIQIHAVVFKEGDWWIAQFLEYDLSTAARRLEDLPAEMRRFMLGQLAADYENGFPPFNGHSPAPKKYWRMFEQAESWGATMTVTPPPELEVAPQIEARLAA